MMLENAGYIEKSEGYFIGISDYYPAQLVVVGRLCGNEENINYVAAYLRYFIDAWSKYRNLNYLPEILATLYNIGDRTPHLYPEANDFGDYASSVYGHLYEILFGEEYKSLTGCVDTISKNTDIIHFNKVLS